MARDGDGAWITGTAATSAAMAAVPVIAGNRVNRLEDAEAILARRRRRPGLDVAAVPGGSSDRGEGARSGGAVNVCITCDQACIDRSLVGGHVSCLVNPRSGYEVDFPVAASSSQDAGCAAPSGGLVRAPSTRRWSAVRGDRRRAGGAGGGAGARGARRARSTSIEAREELGGQFRWARLVPGKEDYGATISYFESELRRLGVHLHLGRELGEDDADVLADCVGVVLATGVHPAPSTSPAPSLPHVVDYADRLRVRPRRRASRSRSSARAASASTSPTC